MGGARAMLPGVTRMVALTGGIATGKSTVSRMFEKLGAVLIDADAITHELQQPGSPVLAEIVAAFGEEVLEAGGGLDRDALAGIVFRDSEARTRLNAIMHPPIGVEMARRAEAARRSGAALVIIDAPVLFEAMRSGRSGAARLGFDAILVVYAREDQQIERQLARNAYDRAEAERRVRAQIPIEEKRGEADFVIDNSGNIEETQRQVRELYERLVREN